jgi:hypothetical protein
MIYDGVVEHDRERELNLKISCIDLNQQKMSNLTLIVEPKPNKK